MTHWMILHVDAGGDTVTRRDNFIDCRDPDMAALAATEIVICFAAVRGTADGEVTLPACGQARLTGPPSSARVTWNPTLFAEVAQTVRRSLTHCICRPCVTVPHWSGSSYRGVVQRLPLGLSIDHRPQNDDER